MIEYSELHFEGQGVQLMLDKGKKACTDSRYVVCYEDGVYWVTTKEDPPRSITVEKHLVRFGVPKGLSPLERRAKQQHHKQGGK